MAAKKIQSGALLIGLVPRERVVSTAISLMRSFGVACSLPMGTLFLFSGPNGSQFEGTLRTSADQVTSRLKDTTLGFLAGGWPNAPLTIAINNSGVSKSLIEVRVFRNEDNVDDCQMRLELLNNCMTKAFRSMEVVFAGLGADRSFDPFQELVWPRRRGSVRKRSFVPGYFWRNYLGDDLISGLGSAPPELRKEQVTDGAGRMVTCLTLDCDATDLDVVRNQFVPLRRWLRPKLQGWLVPTERGHEPPNVLEYGPVPRFFADAASAVAKNGFRPSDLQGPSGERYRSFPQALIEAETTQLAWSAVVGVMADVDVVVDALSAIHTGIDWTVDDGRIQAGGRLERSMPKVDGRLLTWTTRYVPDRDGRPVSGQLIDLHQVVMAGMPEFFKDHSAYEHQQVEHISVDAL